MDRTYEQRLGIYYIGTVVYLVTLILYTVVAGSLIGEEFTVVWRDPIVYLLGIVSLVSLVGLLVAVILNKKIVVREDALLFTTRFKERRITPEQIEWIAVTRGSRGKIRQGRAERAARMKLAGRRRRLWVRPALFEDGDRIVRDLVAWAERNGVEIRKRKGGGGSS